MTVLTAPTLSPDPTRSLWRVSVEHYHEMIDAGIITTDDRVELLEGYIVEKPVMNPPHARITNFVTEILRDIAPKNCFVDAQCPITLTASEPQPDILFVRGKRRDFFGRHPYAQDVPLLIEVSDSTLYTDRQQKQRIYANDGIPVYWIINLQGRQIEVYTIPINAGLDPTYARREIYFENNNVPIVIDGETVATIAVSELLPPL